MIQTNNQLISELILKVQFLAFAFSNALEKCISIITENFCIWYVTDFINVVKVSINYWLCRSFFIYKCKWHLFCRMGLFWKFNSFLHFLTSFSLSSSLLFYSAPQALCVPQSADILTKKLIILFFPHSVGDNFLPVNWNLMEGLKLAIIIIYRELIINGSIWKCQRESRS